MKKMMFLLASLMFATGTATAANPYDYKVIRVIDGDTIVVETLWTPPELGNSISLRIMGIDTPEKGGRAKCKAEADLGERATAFAKETIKPGQIVQVNLISWDKFGGRIDADVFVNGENFGDMQVSRGLARPYDGKAKSSWCE